jgi:hypothetical protein
MHPPRRSGLLLKSCALGAFVTIIPACHQNPGAARPYSAQRPIYTPQPVRPVRIGGYAGYNYGRRAPVPVTPVEDIEAPR